MANERIPFAAWRAKQEMDVSLVRTLFGIVAPIDMDDTDKGRVYIGDLNGPHYATVDFIALVDAGVSPIDFDAVIAASVANKSIFERIWDAQEYAVEAAPKKVAAGLKELAGKVTTAKSVKPTFMVSADLPLEPNAMIAVYPKAAPLLMKETQTVADQPAKVDPASPPAVVAPIKDLDTVKAVAPDHSSMVVVRLGRAAAVVAAHMTVEEAEHTWLAYLAERGIVAPLTATPFVANGEHVVGRPAEWLSEQLPFTEFVKRPMGMAPQAVVPLEVVLPIDGVAVDFLEPGAAVLVAPTAWGKSVFLTRGLVPALLEANHPTTVISYNEPIEQGTLLTQAVLVSQPIHLLARVGAWLLDPTRNVLVIDSLRAFVYSKSAGGTGTKGFDQLLFTQLTGLSNAALYVGKVIVLALNPLVDDEDEERVREIHDGIRASVTTAMLGRNQPSRSLSVERRGLTQTDRTALTGTVRQLVTAADAMVSSGLKIEDPTPSAVPEQLIAPHLSRVINIA